MRQAFARALVELAEHDERVFLLTADLGFRVLEPFRDRFPDRYINVGVAEQNMMGIATGLALEGYTPFVYSIAAFATTRCFEQLRIGPVLHSLPVRIVGTGAGFAYAAAGPTHYVHEDVAMMRAQPGLEILAPLLPSQMHAAVRRTADTSGPVYLRIGQDRQELGEPNEAPETWHDVLTFGSGERTGVYTWGSTTQEAVAAARSRSDTRVVAMQRLSSPCPVLPIFETSLRVEESMPQCSVFTASAAAAARGLHLIDPLVVSANAKEHAERQGLDRQSILRALEPSTKPHDATPTESDSR